jgi:hypothetical protein
VEKRKENTLGWGEGVVGVGGRTSSHFETMLIITFLAEVQSNANKKLISNSPMAINLYLMGTHEKYPQ